MVRDRVKRLRNALSGGGVISNHDATGDVGRKKGGTAAQSASHRRGLRVAMGHHWFIEPRGGERVLAHFAEMFPEAPILTSVATDPADWWPAPIAALRSRMVTGPTQPILRHLAGRRWGEP